MLLLQVILWQKYVTNATVMYDFRLPQKFITKVALTSAFVVKVIMLLIIVIILMLL